MRKAGVLAILLVLVFVWHCPAIGDDDVWPQEASEARLEPGHQLAIGLAMRLDEQTTEQHRPNISAQYLRFLNDNFAFRAELGFTPAADFGYNERAAVVTSAFGIRIQDQSGVINPFLEFDFGIWRFFGEANDRDYRETYPAFGGGAGLSIRSSGGSRIEAGVRVVLNHIGARSDVVAHPGLPPEPPYDPAYPSFQYLGDPFPEELLNLGQFFLRYRFGL